MSRAYGNEFDFWISVAYFPLIVSFVLLFSCAIMLINVKFDSSVSRSVKSLVVKRYGYQYSRHNYGPKQYQVEIQSWLPQRVFEVFLVKYAIYKDLRPQESSISFSVHLGALSLPWVDKIAVSGSQ